MIEDSPFNIDATDFIGIFGGKYHVFRMWETDKCMLLNIYLEIIFKNYIWPEKIW